MGIMLRDLNWSVTVSTIACTQCGALYPERKTPYQCDCGGVFDYVEFPEYQGKGASARGLWAYLDNPGFWAGKPSVSLGEGSTPLIQVPFGGLPLWLKMESANPTGSYKDRGSTTLVSFLKDREVTYAVEDSSGNAGASFAAYCARGALRCKVFVPESASGPKRTQIEMFGAELVRVPGPRSEAARAVLAEANSGAVYGSHAFMPFGLPGIATIAYEIVEQLGSVPASVIAPVGHGGLLYGVMRGFEAMKEAGVIQEEPMYIGAQAAACAPVAAGYYAGVASPKAITPGETIAEGVKVAVPARGAAILSRMREGKGQMLSITEESLRQAYVEMAHAGVYCEPTSALVWAAASSMEKDSKKPTVAIITGSGYKSVLNLTGIV